MKAIGFTEYGGPGVLSVVEIPQRMPGQGQVRIRSRATPVNPADVWFREGGVARLVGDAERPLVPGLELAGVVESVGRGTRFVPGDRVLAVTSFIATGRGAHAELVVVDEADVALIPEDMLFGAASTVPMNGLTAIAALEAAGLDAGGTLAVVGAAGVVGGFVVQMALARGITVIAVAGEEDRPALAEWGVDDIVPRHDAAAGVRAVAPGGVDALVDCATVGEAVMPAVRAGGTLVTLRPLGPAGIEMAGSLGLSRTLVSVRAYQGDSARLDGLVGLVVSGEIRLRPTAELGLSEAATAHSRVAAGGLRQRQVLLWP